MGAAAGLERGLIGVRLRGGRRRKAQKGGYVGGKRLHPRYGYRLLEGEYVPQGDEQGVIERINAMRAAEKPMTWAATAGALNDDRVAPPSGVQWYPATAMRIAKREASVVDG